MNFEDYESLPTSSFGVHMTAGALAGVMEHCVMYPLDAVKTRMQSLRLAHNRTIIQTLSHMVRTEGLYSCVRGMGAVVAGAGPAHACFFATYEHAKHTLSRMTRHSHEHITHGLSGCLASLVHDAVSNPAEVVKQRLQMAGSPYRGVLHCAGVVYRAEGLKAFYRSYPTQLTMNVPFQAVHFVAYEYCQQRLNPARSYSPLSHLCAGGVAGALAAAATAPLDVCKTLLNTQQARTEGLRQAVLTVYRRAGARGFARGATARVLYQTPAAGICWLTYETFKHTLRTIEEDGSGAPCGVGSSVGAASVGGVGGSGVISSVPSTISPPLACAALRLAAADHPRNHPTLTRT